MKSLIEYKLDDDSFIFIEVEEEPQGPGIEPASRDGNAVHGRVVKSFNDELDKVVPAANAIITKFRNLDSMPDEVQVGFGLKMGASAGAIITSGTIEANFNVTLKWSKE
jgi:hypothetical protein